MKPPSLRGWIAGALRFSGNRRSLADCAGVALPSFAAREADRRVHDRPIYRRDREPVRSGLVLRARHHSGILSRGSRFCRWRSSTASGSFAASAQPQLARLVRLAFVWIAMPLLFFSFAGTKLPNYIALEFPALALITALYFEAVVRQGWNAFRRHFGGDRAGDDRRARARDCGLFAQQPSHRRDRRCRPAAARDGDCDLRRLVADRAARRSREERAACAVRTRARRDRSRLTSLP